MTVYHRNHPFLATLVERTLLSKEGSTHKTYHVTLDVACGHFTYKPGDAFAIFPENTPQQVDDLLKAFGQKERKDIIHPRSKRAMSLVHFLKTQVNLNRVSPSLLATVGMGEPHTKERNEWQESIRLYDLIDFFKAFPPRLPIQDVIAHFSPLLPRFYSIASSPTLDPTRVDLLVKTFSYQQGKKEKTGLGSDYICHQAPMNTPALRSYLQPTSHFILPEDSNTPIIMIGPGTGIAPYRAFLQEREATKSFGTNWLFFGERNRETDYYYQPYLESLVNKQFLSIDLAFSRDALNPCYVQDRLLQKGEAVWNTIAQGAYVYICGNASHMAKEVLETLSLITRTYGGVVGDTYIKHLRKTKRLLLDVY